MADLTLLEAVKKIVIGVGENPPSSVSGYNPTYTKAVDAVNDALEDVYNEAQWDWRLSWAEFTVSTGTHIFTLPGDFGEFAFDWAGEDPIGLMTYVPYIDFIKAYPFFRGYLGQAGADLQTIGQWSLDVQEHLGVPDYYTSLDDTMYIWPPPDADWVAEQTVSKIFIPYYKMPTEVTSDLDVVNIPSYLRRAHYYLSLAYLKQYLEHQDFQADEARGWRALRTQVKRKLKRTPQRSSLAFKEG